VFAGLKSNNQANNLPLRFVYFYNLGLVFPTGFLPDDKRHGLAVALQHPISLRMRAFLVHQVKLVSYLA
jgi:hypothetical protein